MVVSDATQTGGLQPFADGGVHDQVVRVDTPAMLEISRRLSAALTPADLDAMLANISRRPNRGRAGYVDQWAVVLRTTPYELPLRQD